MADTKKQKRVHAYLISQLNDNLANNLKIGALLEWSQ
jgi:hypothetical protein